MKRLSLNIIGIFTIFLLSVLNVSSEELMLNETHVINAQALKTLDGNNYLKLEELSKMFNLEIEYPSGGGKVVVKYDTFEVAYYLNSEQVSVNGMNFWCNSKVKRFDGEWCIPVDILPKTLNISTEISDNQLKLQMASDYQNYKELIKNQKVTSLMYHHILSAEEKEKGGWALNGCVNTLKTFLEQMLYIKDEGFNTITCEQLEAFLYKGKPLPKSKFNNSILITFDDGYLSNYTYAYPIMKALGLKGTIFHVTVNTPEQSIGHLDIRKLDKISREQMKDMVSVFEHQMHTYAAHSTVNGVPDLIWMTDSQIKEDIAKCRQSLEGISTGVYLAYPFGAYDEEAIKALKEVGVKLAFTTQGGYIKKSSNPMKLKRYGVFPWVKFEQFKGYLNN